MRAPVLALLLLAACGPRVPDLDPAVLPPDLQWEGPDRVQLDLLRTSEGGPRIYVQATLSDGEPGLFLVDTGADVNVLHREVAERLDLTVREDAFRLAGLGGATTAGLGVVPEVRLGEAVLRDLPFAVGVRGVPERAGFMPLDGILGMETWKRFVLEIDYPKDRLTLHRPGTVRLPRRAEPLYFDGHRIEAAIELTTAEDPTTGREPLVDTIILQVDTGASALLLSGPTGLPFASAATEGLEPVYGVGASEFMPPSRFLRETRRIHVVEVDLGGRSHDLDVQAQWLDYDRAWASGPLTTRGLIGHRVLAPHRVFLDAQGGRIALSRSRGSRRQLDGHRILLEQDLERHGADAPGRDLFRARMLAALDRWEEAEARLEAWIAAHPDDAEGRVLLARARRFEADLPGAWRALEGLGPGGLVDEGEIVAAVNGLTLEGRHDEALALAGAAIDARPDEADAHIALADAHLAGGRPEDARAALLHAADRMQNPDGFLLRRARVAMALGDRHGALALVRRLVRLYPTEGKFLWYYAMLIQTADEAATLRADAREAVGRLHPDLRPLDFLVGTHHLLGDDKLVSAYLDEGLGQACDPMEIHPPSQDNCVAWFHALAGRHLDDALERVERALAAEGPRSDYLDTKAVVHLARGELEQAHEAAVRAARLMPDDVYMLWQVERIEALQRQAGVSLTP
jgi:tetratricopeptide (TPR) repeat protein